MKRIQRGFAVTMAIAVLMSTTVITSVMATKDTTAGIQISKSEKTNLNGKGDSRNSEKEDGNNKIEVKSTDKENGNDKTKSKSTDKEKGKADALKEAKTSLEAEKEAIETQKDKLEEQKDILEKQYEAAKTSGDLELAAQLKTKIEKIKIDMDALKQQIKEKRTALKAAIKSNYTTDELTKLQLVGEKIKKNNKNIAVLPVENIMVKGINIKFDTPPVIKSGRTLIPVKALSEAFGANVQWVAAERKVIITKGVTQIVLTLDSNKIYVNGVETKIDVPACSINGRTVVPMKFIVEQLGLTVNWHSDTKDIEIGDSTNPIPPVTTTGSAITVTGQLLLLTTNT